MDARFRTKPSCVVILILLAILIAIFVWAVSGTAVKTPSPVSTTAKGAPQAGDR